ncbi:hypothetical protein [Pseudobutyrivibrio sp.]|jgi:hypothetical protein|uniref:hypothetical protein n=1 Tax=Pseudobutyrivibrio sp. TaxID=2014367 RepID=UPI0025ECE691|nr:hypothetical protein [Pseudobutyrivibrio sp.]
MNDLLIALGNGIDRYNKMNEDDKNITEIAFNSVTSILSADITAKYTDADITALKQNASRLSMVSGAVTDKAQFIAFAHLYPTFKKDGKVKTYDGAEIKTLQNLAKWAGVTKSPKQRGSDYKAILEMPLDLALYKDRTIGNLKAIADAIAKGVDPESIKPDITSEQLKELVKQATTIETSQSENGQTENGQSENEQSENGQTENGQSENKPTEPISYDEKSGSFYFRDCTLIQFLAWVNEHVSNAEFDDVSKVFIKGAINIKDINK